MRNAKSLVDMVSKYLVDHEDGYEFILWSEADLLSYLNLALQIVAEHNANLFTAQRAIPLQSGAVQDIPISCESPYLRGVKIPGQELQLPRHIKTGPNSGIQQPQCTNSTRCGNTYKMVGWSIASTDSTKIYVTPPVPEGVTGELILECYAPPTVSTIEAPLDIPERLIPAIFELMLYYAYGVDIESSSMIARADSHFARAFALLGVRMSAAGTLKGTA